MLNQKVLVLLLLASLLNISCEFNTSKQFPYHPPEYINDGLEVGTLAEVGLDTQMILNINERIKQGKYKEVHSMLIYKDGKLVFEEYYSGHKYQWDRPGYHGEYVAWDRDMLKFGIVYLHGGEWNGEQIIPGRWVEKSRIPYGNNTGIRIPIDDSCENGYPYTWWTNSISHSREEADIFAAGGRGGQSITVIPDKNMVVVFTGGNYSGRKGLHEILERFIFPASL